LSDYDLLEPSSESLIQPITGGINQPLFSLTKETVEGSVSKIDTICPFRCLVQLDMAMEDYGGLKIVGFIRFCSEYPVDAESLSNLYPSFQHFPII
jgi:hypothetical protein